MGSIFRVINSNGNIEVSEYKKANAIFQTNEYSELEEVCIHKEVINVFDLLKENQELKKQLEYFRSNEYLNQLRFERDMLQDVVNKGKVSKEDKDFIDCTHRNTELLEENQKLKKQLENAINAYTDEYNLRHNSDLKLDILRTQQKKFIKYLEDEIDKLVKEYGNYVYDDYSEEKGKYDTCIEILQKYKEIVGVSDENNIS